MSPARTIFLTAVLALAVAVLELGLIRLVTASGAADQPAVILLEHDPEVARPLVRRLLVLQGRRTHGQGQRQRHEHDSPPHEG